jgi:RNA polymerase sigma factor (sigma-70 family)
MMTTQAMSVTECNDAALVTESLAGKRDAFGRIVGQYQSLICSLAYSATGSLSKSEDLAQETFLAAWTHLPELQDPSKLRGWLCGIARNLIGKTLRRDGHEPAHVGGSLQAAQEIASPQPLPPAQAISREEEAILWRALERVDETYREPLVLFYREQQSVERVAEALELTPDAVRQRLSRGRKLLQEQVLAFVEGALEKSAPGPGFTGGVLAALPIMTTSAKAAVAGATAAKAGAAAKSAGLAALSNAIFGPVAMFLSLYFDYRLNRDTARSTQRRQLVVKFYRILVICLMACGAAFVSLTLGSRSLIKYPPMIVAGLAIGFAVVFFVLTVALVAYVRLGLRKIRRQEIAEGRPAPLAMPLFEHRSKHRLLGLPLVHIRIRGGEERGAVKAWIAGGDAAIGMIFAFGGVAIAPISFGGFALGLVTLGGFAVGLLSSGGLSFGLWAIGGVAVGLQAFGGCAIAWSAAYGGVCAAHDIAIGGIPLARHANDAVASAFLAKSTFFQTALAAMQYGSLLNLLWLLPLVLWLSSKKKGLQTRGT